MTIPRPPAPRWVALLAAVLLPLALRAAGPNAIVTGTVLGPDAKPAARVLVTLQNSVTGYSRSITTGADGAYTFNEVPPGEGYTVAAARDGRAIDARPAFRLNAGDDHVIVPPLGFFAANLPKAQQGDAKAQVAVGFAYQRGLGVQQDYPQALHWFRLSADQGNAAAQDNLAVMYEHGWGVPRDYVQAVHYARLAADQGYAYAEYRTGFYYEFGRGQPKDVNQAITWYRKAVEHGNGEARQRLIALGQTPPPPAQGQGQGQVQAQGQTAGGKAVSRLLGAAFDGLGNPLAGARVGIGPADSTTPHTYATTGKDGTFSFYNVPSGAKYRVALYEGQRLVDSRFVDAVQGEHSLPPLIEHAGGAKTAAGDTVVAPPLRVDDIVELLTGGVSRKRVSELVEAQGVTFSLDDASEKKIRTAGGDSDLLITIAKSRRQ